MRQHCRPCDRASLTIVMSLKVPSDLRSFLLLQKVAYMQVELEIGCTKNLPLIWFRYKKSRGFSTTTFYLENYGYEN